MKLASVLRKPSNENAVAVTLQLLNKLNVTVTESTVVSTLEYHPDYPSLLSISESLKSWNVDNVALQISPEQLDDLPLPFIAHLKNDSGYFTLVTKLSPEAIICKIDAEKEVQKKKVEFLNEWSGIVLVAEANEKSGEADYRKRRRKERLESLRIPFMLSGLFFVIVIYAYTLFLQANALFLFVLLFLLLKLMGASLASLLLWFEIDQVSLNINNICKESDTMSCKAVLQSKASKLFSWLSWSEIGFFYFGGGLLFLLFTPAISTDTFSILAWMNILVLPYIFFSVGYQGLVINKWCRLCLLVQGTLLLEGVVAYFGFWRTHSILSFPTEPLFANIVTAFALLPLLWLFGKPFLLEAIRNKQNVKEKNQLKYNKSVFFLLLQQQKKVRVPRISILIGNPDAATTILKVSSPYCTPCSAAYNILTDILERNNNINVQIIFVTPADKNDYRYNITHLLMALSETKDMPGIKAVMDEWYNTTKKDYESFASKYGTAGTDISQMEKLQEMSQWCVEANATSTPTIFINGHPLPKAYKVEDLRYLF